ERLVLNLKDQGIEVPSAGQPAAYVTHVGDSPQAAVAANDFARHLRDLGVPTVRSVGQRSVKARLRHADAAGVRWTALIGDDELAAGTVSLRDMTQREPATIPVDEALHRIWTSMHGQALT